MSFLHPKINPFCPFAISLGPLYVERALDYQLTLNKVPNIVRMPSTERYEHYLKLLHQKNTNSRTGEYPYIQFFKGHFYNQLANITFIPQTAQHHREKALCYFQIYLEIADRLEEISFYAQWQIGLLLDVLKYPWAQVKNALLKAYSIDSVRAEPLKALVQHYIKNKDWDKAYAFSSVLLRDHLDRNPATTRRWFIDSNAYNWNLLYQHFSICYKTGYWDEVLKSHKQMLAYKSRHVGEFNDTDIRRMHSVEKLLQSPKSDPRYSKSV